jgi:CRP-like cAMP-binding protein
MTRQQVGLFQGLSPAEQDDVLSEYFLAETNFRGTTVQGFAWISRGEAKICVRIQRERNRDQITEIVLAKLSQGTFLGEIIVLWPSAGPTAYVLASRQCAVRYLRNPNHHRNENAAADVFRNLIQEYPQIAINVISEMGRRLRGTGRLIPAHPEGRVALYLKEAADRHGSIEVQDSRVDAMQEALAISETAVRNALNKLESSGIIKRTGNGAIIVQDFAELDSHLIL